MSSSLVFIATDRPKPQVTKDLAYGFTFRAFSSGTAQTPSAATITIRGPGGAPLATPVVDAACTITGNDMTYALTSGNAGVLGANYTADVSYTVSGTVYHGRVLFDVVRQPLRNVVITADLVRHHNDLSDSYFSGETTAEVYIAQAFEDVYQAIDAKGRRPWLVMSSEDLRRPIEHRALELYFLARTKSTDDRWWTLMSLHRDRYTQWLQSVQLVYDMDESGTADGTDSLVQAGEEGGKKLGAGWRI